jgi:hypothetical protein
MIGQDTELLRDPHFPTIFPVLLLQLPKKLLVSVLVHDPNQQRIHVALHVPHAVPLVIEIISELPLLEPLDVLHSRVVEIEGRHDRDDVAHTIPFQFLRILGVDEVDLGHRRPDGDVLELVVLVTRIDHISRNGLDGHHVVLVAIHEEPLQKPGITWFHVVQSRPIVYSRVGGS